MALTGFAPKLQATTRSGDLFRSKLPLIVSAPDFWCKAALTQEQKDKIAEWLKSQGIENCLACSFSGEMRYSDVVALPVVGLGGGQTVVVGSGEHTVTSGGQTVISGTGGGRVVIGGEEVDPVGDVVPITCSNCGYTMLFSKELLPL